MFENSMSLKGRNCVFIFTEWFFKFMIGSFELVVRSRLSALRINPSFGAESPSSMFLTKATCVVSFRIAASVSVTCRSSGIRCTVTLVSGSLSRMSA
jgi:hypothetical protein